MDKLCLELLLLKNLLILRMPLTTNNMPLVSMLWTHGKDVRVEEDNQRETKVHYDLLFNINSHKISVMGFRVLGF